MPSKLLAPYATLALLLGISFQALAEVIIGTSNQRHMTGQKVRKSIPLLNWHAGRSIQTPSTANMNTTLPHLLPVKTNGLAT